MRCAIINATTTAVENVIEIDDLDDWETPAGFEVVASADAQIGWTRVGGVFVAPTAAPPAPITALQVKAEAQRRIVALVGSSDLQSCIIKQLNMLMRGIELANKKVGGVVLIGAEAAEAVALQATADAIKAIRVKSNAIEALTPVPNDYTADVRWT